MVTNSVSHTSPLLAVSELPADQHVKRFRAYRWRKALEMVAVVAVGLVGLFFISLLMLIK